MEVLNRDSFGKCQICNINQVLGVFRNKWVCGLCLLKIEQKIREEKNKYLDLVEQEIAENAHREINKTKI